MFRLYADKRISGEMSGFPIAVVLLASCLTLSVGEEVFTLSMQDPLACVTKPAAPITRYLDATIPVVVESPGYNASDPSTVYPADQICQWTFDSTDFGDEFLMTIIEVDVDCVDFNTSNGDAIEAFDSLTFDPATSYGLFCGGDNKQYISTTHTFSLKFTSGNFNQAGGFRARVGKAIIPDACNPGGEVITTPTNIFTPDYPFNYPENSDCQYFIDTPAGMTANIHINNFDVAGACNDDILELYGGLSVSPLNWVTSYWRDMLSGDLRSTGDLTLRFISNTDGRSAPGLWAEVTFI